MLQEAELSENELEIPTASANMVNKTFLQVSNPTSPKTWLIYECVDCSV